MTWIIIIGCVVVLLIALGVSSNVYERSQKRQLEALKKVQYSIPTPSVEVDSPLLTDILTTVANDDVFKQFMDKHWYIEWYNCKVAETRYDIRYRFRQIYGMRPRYDYIKLPLSREEFIKISTFIYTPGGLDCEELVAEMTIEPNLSLIHI